MKKITIKLNVHENNVETVVRVYHTQIAYEEYASGSEKLFLALLECETPAALHKLASSFMFDEPSDVWKEPFLEGFGMTFQLSLNVNLNIPISFDVTEARHIDVSLGGGKDVTESFDNMYKRAILTNIAKQLATKNVGGLRTVVTTLREMI